MATVVEYTRQSSIVDVKRFRENEIMIVGCGAIGSFTAISLAKMGLTDFILFDDDKVEPHNLPNQFFTINDIGKLKVDATKQHMKSFNDEVLVTAFPSKFKESDYKSTIIICCADSMKARKQVFEFALKNKETQMYIDSRMGGTQGQLYTVDLENKEQIESYKKTLFGDNEAVQMRCTERSIIFTCLGLASLICNQVVKAFKEEELSNYIVLDYSVPQMM